MWLALALSHHSPVSFVIVNSAVTQYLIRSAQALVCLLRSGVFWKGALAVQGLSSEWLPQMATVGAGDSPKAVLACLLLSIYLFVLPSARRLSKS